MKLKKFTDYETGLSIYIDVDRITSHGRLPAKVYSLGAIGDNEIGERTRIDTDRDTFLVRETPEEALS